MSACRGGFVVENDLCFLICCNVSLVAVVCDPSFLCKAGLHILVGALFRGPSFRCTLFLFNVLVLLGGVALNRYQLKCSIDHDPLAATQSLLLHLFLETIEKLSDPLLAESLPEAPDCVGIRHLIYVRHGKKVCKTASVLQSCLHHDIAEVVKRLQNQNLEHQDLIVMGAPHFPVMA